MNDIDKQELDAYAARMLARYPLKKPRDLPKQTFGQGLMVIFGLCAVAFSVGLPIAASIAFWAELHAPSRNGLIIEQQAYHRGEVAGAAEQLTRCMAVGGMLEPYKKQLAEPPSAGRLDE